MDQKLIEDIKQRMDADFLPEPSASALSHGDRRMADAAEYAAYSLGQINKKLDRLITLLEARSEPNP